MNDQSVPVVEHGTSEGVTGLDLTFLAVTKMAAPGNGVASLIALYDLAPIGHLRWDIEDGELTFVFVTASFRRKRVATVLWQVAGEVAAAQGWAALTHSASRSLEGDEWARAVGGELPPMLSPPRPYETVAAEGSEG